MLFSLIKIKYQQKLWYLQQYIISSSCLEAELRNWFLLIVKQIILILLGDFMTTWMHDTLKLLWATELIAREKQLWYWKAIKKKQQKNSGFTIQNWNTVSEICVMIIKMNKFIWLYILWLKNYDQNEVG